MLTLKEQVAQLVFVRLGSNMPPPVPVAEDAERVAALLDRCPIGGLLLFNGNRETTPALLADLQQRSRRPLLVASDIERGVGQQFRGATVFPHAMALGAADATGEVVEQVARVTAREALACGVHMTFAPVADVNRHPRNPIIATRAFGTEPEHVTRCVAAYVRGCRAEGLLTTAKHFPGHGGTHGDSHAELPVVEDERAVLERLDLPPFRAAIAAGVDTMMTAHVAFSALDAPDCPATLSRAILEEMLRGELGFAGAVVSDSLLMGSITSVLEDVGARAAALVAAGVDVLLDPEDPEAVVDGLVRAVEEGRLGADRVAEACGHVQVLKQHVVDRFGTDAFAGPQRTSAAVDWKAHAELARRVAREAVRIEQEDGPSWLPDTGEGTDMLVVQVVAPACGAAAEQVFRQALLERLPRADVVAVEPEAGAASVQAVCDAAAGARHVVVVLQARPAAWHAYGLTSSQQAAARRLVGPRTVVAALGSPVLLEEAPDAGTTICTYSDAPPAQEALVDVLSGRPAAVAQ